MDVTVGFDVPEECNQDAAQNGKSGHKDKEVVPAPVVAEPAKAIIDNTGYKMAREAIWPCWAGMWLSSFALLPIGVFLTYKAATDSGLFNPEVWVKAFNNAVIKVQDLWTRLKKR